MKQVLEVAYGTSNLLLSRFEAMLFPLHGEEEVPSCLEAIKKAFPKADHYPYGYLLPGRSKSSDDGEPGGTAGRPLASLLESEGVVGLLAVARYFGGTKLGTGNLRRCFVEAGKDALAHARLAEEEARYVYRLRLSYRDFETLRRVYSRLDFEIQDARYGEEVDTTLLSRGKLKERLEALGIFDPGLLEEERITVLMECKRQ